MRAGRMRHRLTIQTVTETQNAVGELTRVWAEAVTVWGQVRPLSGKETLTGEQITADVSHRVFVRYNENIAATARILWGTRVFEINAVLNADEIDRSMELLCKEVV